MKKLLIILPSLILSVACAAGQTNWNLTFAPSPDDNGTNGLYLFTALPTNAPSISAQVPLTNAPAGSTNVFFAPGWMPGNPCFIFGVFATATSTSALSGPLWFDTNVWNIPPAPPRPLPRPPVVIRH